MADDPLVARLRALDICDISDAIDALGMTPAVTGLVLTSGKGPIAGRAITVKIGIGPSPPGVTSPSIMPDIGPNPPIGVKESLALSTAPSEVCVIETLKRALVVSPKAAFLPSVLPTVECTPAA